MTIDLLMTIAAVALSLFFMARHISRELRASAKGKCGACDLHSICQDRQSTHCDLDSARTIHVYDPDHMKQGFK